MATSALILNDGDASHRMLITHRDWGLLWGPFFAEGPMFSTAFGIYDNFTVAHGIPKGSYVIRSGRKLFGAARGLLAAIERDADLLRFDYSYSFDDEPIQHNGGQSVRLRGRGGILSTRPKGYCSIKLLNSNGKGPRIAELIDLRIVGELTLDNSSVVKIHRRSKDVLWAETLPPLLEFLRPRIGKELTVEHIDRVDSRKGAIAAKRTDP
jgi:hypothetical protein